jgi:membrane-associated protease RseP (regulator of RpoE activity)
VKFTPSSASSQNITAYYPGDSENDAAIGTGSLVVGQTTQATGLVVQTVSSAPEGYIGIDGVNDSTLKGMLSQYSSSFLTRPVLYLCIPTFPQCESLVPFSGSMAVFYSSPYGSWLIPLASLLYWLFFLNFNLAVFNALPLYPLDGGQAFRVAVQGLARGRLSERTLTWISTIAALAVVAVVAAVPFAAYLHLI